MNKSEFVAAYGGIYEHSPWVAERVQSLLGDQWPDTNTLAKLMADCVDNASEEMQLELIRAHPDLAGKAQIAGALTADSTEEQSRAGLDQCSADEFERFQVLNEAYKKKFGFPFIKATVPKFCRHSRHASKMTMRRSSRRRCWKFTRLPVYASKRWSKDNGPATPVSSVDSA